MSSIDKMTILGIRSFGVQDEDRQLIAFEHPLTLIVGKNGAGKTSIIECLKFATTGDLPGNSRGGAFVHDPKLIGESDVRAQVALKFCSTKNLTFSIKRSLQVSLKGDKITQKTLDSVITKTVRGETVSTTTKCSVIDAEMVGALGVSKAVLENVIFCHQEDSNWPLSESKIVKAKFDEIFASTRYIKALDKFKDVRKEFEKSRREKEVEQPHLEVHLETSTKKTNNLQEQKMKLKVAEDSKEKAIEDLKPIETQLKEKRRKQTNFEAIKINLKQRQQRKADLVGDTKRYEGDRIQNLFEGTDEQLEEVIAGQQSVITNKKIELADSRRETGPRKREIDALTKRKDKLSIEQGALQQEEKNFEEKKAKRMSLISKTSDKYDMTSILVQDSDEISDYAAIDFEKELKTLVQKAERSMNDKKLSFDKKIDAKSEEHKKVWSEKTVIDGDIKQNQQSIKEKNNNIQKTSQEIQKLQSSSDSDRLEKLQHELDQAAQKLKIAEDSFDERQSKDKEVATKRMKSNRESQLKDIDDEISLMQKHERQRSEISFSKNLRSQKDDSIKKLKRRNIDSLSEIQVINSGDGIESSHFPTAQKLNKWITVKTQQKSLLEKELNKKRQEQAKLSTKLDMLSTDYEKKNQRHKEIEDELFELCGSENFDDELTQSDETIRRMQKEKGLSDGVEYLYKEFWKKLTCVEDTSSTPCPLCHRLFDQISEIEELAQEIDQKLQMAPRKRLTQEQDLERKQERHQKLLDQKPAKKAMVDLADELPKLKKEITDHKTKISKLRQSVADIESNISKLQNNIDLGQSCMNDLNQVDNLTLEMKELTRKINLEEAGLPQIGNSNKTFDELNEERQKYSEEIQSHSTVLDKLRADRDKQMATIMSLKTRHSYLQKEKLEIAANVEKCKQLNDNKKLLTKEIESLQISSQESKLRLPPLQQQLEKIDEEMNKLKILRDNELKNMLSRIQDMKSSLQDVTRSNQEIQKYVDSNKKAMLAKNIKDLSRVEETLSLKEQELRELTERISQIDKDLNTCSERQRDLNDNIALRKQKKGIDDVTIEINDIKSQLSGFNIDRLDSEIEKLQERWHSLNREKARLTERESQINVNVTSLEKELESEELKFATEKLSDCKQIKVTTDLAIKDLDKYHRALDRAIMRFHAAKMSEINKIIKEIWTTTYRGHDIDYIEICSGEDIGTSNMGRRNYNYRLVKCVRGQKIDMRGRCSAGQKVLASLVIRLALAETFCINCGILALDEPTTNLDREHIGSLAAALSQIIESRQMQKNFQLIVITHDEDFVELLGSSNRVDHFFRVSKGSDEKSRIRKCSINDLFLDEPHLLLN